MGSRFEHSRVAGARAAAPLLLLCAALGFGADWTIGVYMCADNSMAGQSYVDLAELERVGSSAQVNVVVQVDRPPNDSLAGCRRYYVSREHLQLLAELGPTDMADPAALAGFGTYLRDHYPARNYMLVLWDHGNGWTQVMTNDEARMTSGGRFRSVLYDASSGSTMSVAEGELARALEGFSAGIGKRVRVLGFDACFMGMVEVATEAERWCDYMVAAEGLAPWGGWPYDSLLTQVERKHDKGPKEWLGDLCASYVAQYPGEDVDLGAVDLGKLGRVRRLLADELGEYGAERKAAYHAARASVQTFSESGMRPPCAADDQVDLIHFFELAGASAELRSALSEAVTAHSAAGSYANARGLACWFPDRYLELKGGHELYGGLGFAEDVPWLEFLNSYHNRDDLKPTEPVITRVQSGSHNSVRLWWSKSSDLAPVTYRVYQCQELDTLFADDCEDMGYWSGGGWSMSSSNPHSGAGCFFSDGGPGDTLALAEPVSDGRLVEFYARYSTDEDEDSSGIRHDVCYVDVRELDGWRTVDSLYGRQDSWARCRYRAECAVTGVRFRYVATASGGIYVDDVTLLGGLWGFESVTPEIADTNCLLYNLRGNQDGYQFFIQARDSWGNRSSISDGVRSAAFTSPAEPYSIPSPFSDSCLIVLDRSDASGPSDVSIHSLSGALVRRFPDALPPVHWDGRNEAGQPVADGIYIVVTMGGRVGRIAKVRR